MALGQLRGMPMRPPCLWPAPLLLAVLLAQHGSTVLAQRRSAQATGRSWAEGLSAAALQPSTISNDGNATLQAELQGAGCVKATTSRSLYLAVYSSAAAGAAPTASSLADLAEDAWVPGTVSSDCRTATFRASTSQALQGLPPGAYYALLFPGRGMPPLPCVGGGGAPKVFTVVEAAVARLLGQTATASSAHATVYVAAGLDAPPLLPATLALRLSDPAAADVVPSVLTWRPGESSTKRFTLQLKRHVGGVGAALGAALGAEQAQGASAASGAEESESGGSGGGAQPPTGAPSALFVEVLPVSNVMLDGGVPARVLVSPPVPSFYVVANQHVYRSPPSPADTSNSTSSGSSTSSTNSSSSDSAAGASAGNRRLAAAGEEAGAGTPVDVRVPVRRASPSPFASVLSYVAYVHSMTGCPDRSVCQRAVSNSGVLRFDPDQDEAAAVVWVDWGAVPQQALLQVAITLVPVSNAAAVPAAAMAAAAGLGADAEPPPALHVYGTEYGTCPPGMLGPWTEGRGEAGSPAPEPAAGNASAAGAEAEAAAGWCRGPVMLPDVLLGHLPSEAWTPVLAACDDGNTTLASALGYPVCVPAPPVPASPANATGAAQRAGAPAGAAARPASPGTAAAALALSAAPGGQQPKPRAAGAQQQAPRPLLAVEVRLPANQEVAAVFLPLRAANETVEVLATNCTQPAPRWEVVAAGPTPRGAPAAGSTTGSNSTALPGGAAGNSSSNSSGSSSAPDPEPGQLAGSVPEGCEQRAAGAWARWSVPVLARPCWVSVGVRAPAPAPPPSPPPAAVLSAGAGAGGAQGAGARTSSAGSAGRAAPAAAGQGRRLVSGGGGNGTNTNTTKPAAPANTTRLSSNTTTTAAARGPLLRSYNITLRPLSNPAVFANMSLVLQHVPTRRVLPLCGMPGRLTAAAAAARFGAGYTASREQLAWAAATLAQAVRGSPDALRALRQPLPASTAARTPGSGGAPSAGGNSSSSGNSTRGSSSGGSGSSGGSTTGSLRNRNLGDAPAATAAVSDAPVPSASRPAPAAGAGANGSGQRALSGASPGNSTGAGGGPSPQPSATGTTNTANSTATTNNGTVTDEIELDGFDVPDGSGGAVHLLYNLQYLEWCDPWDRQLVDLALPLGQYDMELAASSAGAVLPTVGPAAASNATDGSATGGGSGDTGALWTGMQVLLPAALRAELIEERRVAAEAAAAALAAALAAAGRNGSAEVQLDVGGAAGGGAGAAAAAAMTRGRAGPGGRTGGETAALAGGAGTARTSALVPGSPPAAAAADTAGPSPRPSRVLLPGGNGTGSGDTVNGSGRGTNATTPAGTTNTTASRMPSAQGGAAAAPTPAAPAGPGPEAVDLDPGTLAKDAAAANTTGTQGVAPEASPSQPASPAESPLTTTPLAATSNSTTNTTSNPTRSSGTGSAGGTLTAVCPPAGGGGGQAAALLPDRRIAATLLAPDGISTARVVLDVFVDYSTAVAAAVAAAAACSAAAADQAATVSGNSTGGAGGGGDVSSLAQRADGYGPSPSQAAAVPAVSAAALGVGAQATPPAGLRIEPPPLSPLDACWACGRGAYSSGSNASVCLMCPPGAYAGEVANAGCAPCGVGSFTFQWGSGQCRLCPVGTFSPRAGATACSVCPPGSTTLLDGGSTCTPAPNPGAPGREGGSTPQYALVLYFRMLLDLGRGSGLARLAANTTGIDASADDIVKVLIAADTAEALRIPASQVTVSRLQEVSPSTFLVNVSATVPLSGLEPGEPGGARTAGSGGREEAAEVGADDLINRLVGDPEGSFPRTKEATGGSVQVEFVDQQVVALSNQEGGLNLHVVLWPTLGGTLLLAVALGFSCSRWLRRRRRAGVALPPLSDALGRLMPALRRLGTPPPVYLVFGEVGFEMADMPAAGSGLAAARQRVRPSKQNLSSLGGGAATSGSRTPHEGLPPSSSAAAGAPHDSHMYAAFYQQGGMMGARI